MKVGINVHDKAFVAAIILEDTREHYDDIFVINTSLKSLGYLNLKREWVDIKLQTRYLY